jgi:hypothetical protein
MAREVKQEAARRNLSLRNTSFHSRPRLGDTNPPAEGLFFGPDGCESGPVFSEKTSSLFLISQASLMPVP